MGNNLKALFVCQSDHPGTRVGNGRAAGLGNQPDVVSVSQGLQPVVNLPGVSPCSKGMDGDRLQGVASFDLLQESARCFGIFSNIQV